MKTALTFALVTFMVLFHALTAKAQSTAGKTGTVILSNGTSAVRSPKANPPASTLQIPSAITASASRKETSAGFASGNASLIKPGGILSKVSGTAACCAAVFLWLLYALLVRVYSVRALIKALKAEENDLTTTGIPGDKTMHHPASLAIRKWAQSPDTHTDRAYRWLDAQIATVFGSLISRGEFLRTACLNISFGATILAFVLATSGGRDVDRMLAEVSGALGATLVGLVLFTIESLTLAKLNAEAVRLEFDGRELIDIWAAGRSASETKSLGSTVIKADQAVEESIYANAS